jgi:threonine/homoserine/homoserine lactone efflux protein
VKDTLDMVTTGIVFGLSAGLSPGPLLTLVITETLKGGVPAGVRVALAPLVTDAPIIAGSLLLLAAFAHAMTFVGVVAMAGGLFIAWMGYENITFSGVGAKADILQSSPLRTGILANLLNPNPYVFWLTVGGPLIFGARQSGPMPAALFLILFYACLVGSKVLVAVAVGHSRRFLKSRVYIWSIRGLGFLLVIFAWFFVKEGLRYLGMLA